MSRFQWTDFLALAEELIGLRGPEIAEARHRTAVGRAYYAAYNLCREAAARHGFPARKSAADHGALAAWLSDDRAPELAWELSELRSSRNAADYDYLTPDGMAWEEEARECLERAQRIVRRLGTSLP